MEILKSHPGEAFVHGALGQILAKQKNWTEAITEYRTELADKSSTGLGAVITRIDLADALIAVGSLDAAEKELGQAREFFNERVDMRGMEQWVPPTRWIAKASLALARLRVRQERLREAVAAVAEALGYDASLLDEVEKSADFLTLRDTEGYRELAAATRSRTSQGLTARFSGSIKWIEMIGHREASVALAERDAQWLMAVDISDTGNASPRFDTRGEVILAIHSPIRLLARSAENAVGKSYTFEVGGEWVDGKAVYHWAQAHEVDPSAPAP